MFDESMLLDGTVGSFADPEEAPPLERPEGALQVFVSGDALARSRAIGLAKDLEQLIQRSLARLAPTGAETARPSKTRPSGENDDVIIAVHGLELAPDAEAELHRVIRARVHEHLTGGEAGT
jgi:hypothetical protein